MHNAEAATAHYGQKIREHKQAIRELKRKREASLPKRYTIGEEIFSSITHGIGAGLAIAALALLVMRAVERAPHDGRAFYIAGWTIFGATMFILYLMSTLYHALTPYGVKKVFAVFDHSSIYLLIAGTYTPFCLSVLRGTRGWILFAIIWGLAVSGITLYSIFGSRMRLLSLFTYLPMGWLIVFAGKPALAAIPAQSMKFLLIGGIFYTAGSVFYALKKIKWTHCVWHCFVLAGTIAHFFSVMTLL
jgi:hemolysin III